MKVKVTRVKGGEALRTDSIEGEMLGAPLAGQGLVVFAPPLESGDQRLLRTSPVQSILSEPSGWRVETRNSTYRVERL